MSPDRLTPLVFLVAILIFVAVIALTVRAWTRKGGRRARYNNKGREGKRQLNPKTGTFH